MEKTLVDEFNTFVAIYEYEGKLWTRISGQIYLELKDFEWLAGVLKALLERIRSGESLRGKETPLAASEDINDKLEKITLAKTPTRKGTESAVKRFDVTQGGWVEC
jgi:hypothetical protein